MAPSKDSIADRRCALTVFISVAIVVNVFPHLCLAKEVVDGTGSGGSETGNGLQAVLDTMFDIGRLWIRATLDQAQRVIDAVVQLSDFTSPLTYAVALPTLLYVLYKLGKLFFAPINRVRYLGEVGYITDGRQTTAQVMEDVKRRRLVGDVPPVYPNGWFCVVESRDLRVGEVKNIHCLGKQLAVFRAEDGTAHVIDAYCPHNGANMAAGGIVRGNCLECPFHGWLFRGEDGKCTHVPYSDSKYIPEQAKVTSYAVVERNGFVMMWFHAEGIDPAWEVPEIEQISSGEWTCRGRSEHIINAHIEEIPENGADVAHLSQVHGPIMTAGIDLRYTYSKWWSFAKHDWIGQWNQDPDPDKKHVGVLELIHRVQVFGKNFPILDLRLTARQIGPGIVYLTFDSLFGSGAYLQVLTPMEPLTQRLVHHVYFHRRTPTIVAKFFLLGEAMMVERDIMIWNNKKYVSKPVFVKSKEDSLVQRHRRWYSQFYTEHSPRLKPPVSELEW